MRCLRCFWVFLLLWIVSCGRDAKRNDSQKSDEIEHLRQQLIIAEQEKNAASTALAETKAELSKVDDRLTKVAAALQPIMGNDFRLDTEITAAAVIKRLGELHSEQEAGTLLRKNLVGALGVSANASDEAIVDSLTQLQTQHTALMTKVAQTQKELEASLKTRDELTAKLKTSQEKQDELADKLKASLNDIERMRSAANVGVFPDTLEPFVGVWFAEAPDVKTIPAGCRLVMRVDSKPGSIIRAVICDDGRTDYISGPAIFFGTSPSPFPGSILLTMETRVERSSCKNGESVIAPIAKLSLDLRTGTGDIPVSYAYAELGDQRVTLHNGAGITELSRNNKCDVISANASRLGSGSNAILKAALKACGIDNMPAGCFAASGYIPAAR